MKILMVIPYLASAYGGTSQVVQSLANTLGQLNINVDVVTTNAEDSQTLSVPINQWISEHHYRVRYFSSWHRSDLVFSPSLIQWLVEHIQHYDIVHTHTLFAPIVTLTHAICRIHQRPYIMTPHGMLDSWALAYKAWKKRVYYACFEKSALECAKSIQVLSLSETEQVNQLGHLQTTFIPNGIHPQEFERLPSVELFYQHFPELKGKILILFLGRIDPKKGLDLLAPAFANVRTTFHNIHLIVAGPDSINFTPTVQSYFADRNCLDAVTFTGMLSGSLKYAALAAANLYVSPSYSEGCSMSILEGMASGLPCIITTECNFPEAAKHGVAHVVNPNPNAIETALMTCLHHPSEAKDMGERARQFIFENYSWDQIASKLKLEYSRILETPIKADVTSTH